MLATDWSDPTCLQGFERNSHAKACSGFLMVVGLMAVPVASAGQPTEQLKVSVDEVLAAVGDE